MNKHLIVIGIAIILLVVGLSGCTEQYSTYEGEPSIKFHRVTYKVTGSADSVSITYENYAGGTTKLSSVDLPWQFTIHSFKTGDYVYVSAQNNGERGYIKTDIYVDGDLLEHSYTSGAYGIASANGVLD